MSYQYTYPTKIGKITIVEVNRKITNIARNEQLSLKDYPSMETLLIKQVIQQIHEYLDGERQYFDFPIQLHGTTFQKKVWRAIIKIPYGETRSYQEIAKKINNPRAARAVGTATKMAPLSLLIPCHRVVSSKGLGGYGSDMDLKIELLDLEQRHHFE